MKAVEALRRVRQVQRAHGVAAGAQALWTTVRRVDELYLIVLSVPRVSQRVLDEARSHSFRFASPEDLTRIGTSYGDEVGAVDFDFLRRGDRCLLQLEGDQLVGFTWIAGSQLVHIEHGFHLNLPDHLAYNYHGFTAPTYRGKAFQAVRHLRLLELLGSEGKTGLFGFVDRLNFASRRGQAKSGYRQVGKLTFRFHGPRVHQWLSLERDFWCGQRRI